MNAENPNINAYLRTKVLTAPPEQLRLFLLDGAIKFARQGVEALKTRNWEGVYTGFSQARNIVLELTNSVRPDVDPVLAQRVQSLYTFIYLQLVDSGLEKDVAKGEKAIELLEFERQTWVMLLEKLDQERGASGQSAAEPAVSEAVEPSPAAGAVRRPALSIQG